MKRLMSIITSTLLLLPTLAYGEETGAAATNPALMPPDLGGLETTFSIIKVLAAFMVVAGVMALVFKLMRKIGPASMSKTGLIEVLDTKMIAQKKYISVIRIGGQDMAVAIAENNMSLLCTLNTPSKTSPDNSTFNKAMETATEQETVKS